MTPDPLSAAADQLAAHAERIASVDAREAAHHAELSGQLVRLADMITTLSRTMPDGVAVAARLDALDRQVADLTGRPTKREGDQGYQPRPTPAWWQLDPDQRRAPIAELRDWAEHVYRPGYGHLAALGPCWPAHDLCLHALDILSQLWCALYLQPDRSTRVLSAQAEYQARILPALSAQMTTETTSCDHSPAAYRRSTG